MDNGNDKVTTEVYQLTPWYFYVLALLFCLIFVVCITFLAWKMDKWWLMMFYILPVICFAGL